MTNMSDQIQNQVLSVVADALEALNRRVEGFEAALNAIEYNVSGVSSNVASLQSSQEGILRSLSGVAANVTGLQSSLSSVSTKVEEMQASDAGLVDVLDRVTVVQQAQPPAPPAAVAPSPPVAVVAPVPDPAAAQAAQDALDAHAAIVAAQAHAAIVAAQAQAAVVAAQAAAAVVAPAPDPVAKVLTQTEMDLDRAFPTKDIVLLPDGVSYGITEPNNTDEVVSASPVFSNPGGHPPFTIASADFYDAQDLVVLVSR